MLQSLIVNGINFVDVQIELRCLCRDPLRYLRQLGVAAPHDGARAGALGRAVVSAQTAAVIPVCKRIKQIFSENCVKCLMFIHEGYLFLKFATGASQGRV